MRLLVLATVLALVLALALGCEGGASGAGGDALAIDPDAMVIPDADDSPRDAPPRNASPAPGAWRTEPSVPVAIQEIAGAVYEGRLWIGGGIDGAGRIVEAVRIFDPATSTWSDGPPLPAPRHHAMMVSTGDSLYFIGGMQTLAFEPLDTAWELRGGTWAPIAALPEDRAAAAAGFAGGRIVIAAGNSSRGGLASSTLLYDPVGGTWSRGAPIPAPREHTSGFVSGGELWVVAGRMNSLSTNTSAVHAYDVATDTWREGPSIPTARGGHGVAILDGIAYVIGGEQPDRALDRVEALDVAAGTWSTIAPVPTPHHGHVALAAAGRIWVIAGGDRPTFAATSAVESFAP